MAIPQNNATDIFDSHDFGSFKINSVLPMSNHENRTLMSIAGFYALLFMIGTCGNAAILAVVHYVRNSEIKARHNTTLTYICILSIVDFLSMLPLPMTIIDQVLGFWMFGTFACKLFRFLEHIGKLFSTFILVAFSLDRYCAVGIRSPKVVRYLLCSMFGLTFVMLSPILISAHSKELIMRENFDIENRVITRLHLYKCVDDMSSTLFAFFALYCFVLAYLAPLILMIFFYYKMLTSLFKQTKSVKHSMLNRKKGAEDRIPVFHIAVYTLAICIFHFICWTPYWVSVLYSLYDELTSDGSARQPTPLFIYFMYVVHALPFINSASNFILYGLLNRQLHQSNPSDRRSSRSNGIAKMSPPLKLVESSTMAAIDTYVVTVTPEHNFGDHPNGFVKSSPSNYSYITRSEGTPLIKTENTERTVTPKPSLSIDESCEDSIVV